GSGGGEREPSAAEEGGKRRRDKGNTKETRADPDKKQEKDREKKNLSPPITSAIGRHSTAGLVAGAHPNTSLYFSITSVCLATISSTCARVSSLRYSPAFCICSHSILSSNALANALDSVAIRSSGTFGVVMAYQIWSMAVTRKPNSFSVGTSGSAFSRSAPVTARKCKLSRMREPDPGPLIAASTWPPMTAG